MMRLLLGLLLRVSLGLLLSPARAGAAVQLSPDGYHVFPGDPIQEALQLAAANRTNKVVKVHAGEYRPDTKRQALIWFNKMHEGIRLHAVGSVTLTAANPSLGLPSDPGFPAVVNHVVYFGDGLSSNTGLSGFRITGANNFVTRERTRELEPNRTIPRNSFFYSDGGAIKIFGRSYPTLRNLEIADNFSSPCGAGISIQHVGFRQGSVWIENCRFLRNRAQATGAAVDLLEGSSARLLNCLFVGNVSNLGEDPVAKASGESPFVNSGVLTVFWKSDAVVRNCTFTGNRNGVDDMAGESTYANCVFADNLLEGGLVGTARYELVVHPGSKVSGCLFRGSVQGMRQEDENSTRQNLLHAPPPNFDKDYAPQAPEYRNAGYRPTRP